MYVSKNIPKSDPNPGKYRDIFSTLFYSFEMAAGDT